MNSLKSEVNNVKSESRSLLDEFRGYDLGHPLLNRVADSFVKAAGVGAVRAISRDAFFIATEGGDTGVDLGGSRKNRFPDLKGEGYGKTVEALVTGTGKEALQWGVAAGVYSGLTYGLQEARGVHDWKNSAVAGAVTGAAIALTADDRSNEQIVQSAITGAAISTAANLLRGIF